MENAYEGADRCPACKCVSIPLDKAQKPVFRWARSFSAPVPSPFLAPKRHANTRSTLLRTLQPNSCQSTSRPPFSSVPGRADGEPRLVPRARPAESCRQLDAVVPRVVPRLPPSHRHVSPFAAPQPGTPHSSPGPTPHPVTSRARASATESTASSYQTALHPSQHPRQKPLLIAATYCVDCGGATLYCGACRRALPLPCRLSGTTTADPTPSSEADARVVALQEAAPTLDSLVACPTNLTLPAIPRALTTGVVALLADRLVGEWGQAGCGRTAVQSTSRAENQRRLDASDCVPRGRVEPRGAVQRTERGTGTRCWTVTATASATSLASITSITEPTPHKPLAEGRNRLSQRKPAADVELQRTPYDRHSVAQHVPDEETVRALQLLSISAISGTSRVSLPSIPPSDPSTEGSQRPQRSSPDGRLRCVSPCSAAELQPSEPSERQPSEPSEGQPSEPSEGQPSEPSEGQPSESSEGQPSESSERQPSEPSEGQPRESSEGQPSESSERQPSEPSEGQPRESSEGQPSDPSTTLPVMEQKIVSQSSASSETTILLSSNSSADTLEGIPGALIDSLREIGATIPKRSSQTMEEVKALTYSLLAWPNEMSNTSESFVPLASAECVLRGSGTCCVHSSERRGPRKTHSPRPRQSERTSKSRVLHTADEANTVTLLSDRILGRLRDMMEKLGVYDESQQAYQPVHVGPSTPLRASSVASIGVHMDAAAQLDKGPLSPVLSIRPVRTVFEKSDIQRISEAMSNIESLEGMFAPPFACHEEAVYASNLSPIDEPPPPRKSPKSQGISGSANIIASPRSQNDAMLSIRTKEILDQRVASTFYDWCLLNSCFALWLRRYRMSLAARLSHTSRSLRNSRIENDVSLGLASRQERNVNLIESQCTTDDPPFLAGLSVHTASRLSSRTAPSVLEEALRIVRPAASSAVSTTET